MFLALVKVAVNVEVFGAATSWAPHEHLPMAEDSRVQVKAGIFVALSLGLIAGETKRGLDRKLHSLEFHKAVWWDQAYSRYQYLLSCGHPRQDRCNNDVLHEAFNNQACSIHEPGSVKVAQQDNGTSHLYFDFLLVLDLFFILQKRTVLSSCEKVTFSLDLMHFPRKFHQRLF